MILINGDVDELTNAMVNVEKNVTWDGKPRRIVIPPLTETGVPVELSSFGNIGIICFIPIFKSDTYALVEDLIESIAKFGFDHLDDYRNRLRSHQSVSVYYRGLKNVKRETLTNQSYRKNSIWRYRYYTGLTQCAMSFMNGDVSYRAIFNAQSAWEKSMCIRNSYKAVFSWYVCGPMYLSLKNRVIMGGVIDMNTAFLLHNAIYYDPFCRFEGKNRDHVELSDVLDAKRYPMITHWEQKVPHDISFSVDKKLFRYFGLIDRDTGKLWITRDPNPRIRDFAVAPEVPYEVFHKSMKAKKKRRGLICHTCHCGLFGTSYFVGSRVDREEYSIRCSYCPLCFDDWLCRDPGRSFEVFMVEIPVTFGRAISNFLFGDRRIEKTIDHSTFEESTSHAGVYVSKDGNVVLIDNSRRTFHKKFLHFSCSDAEKCTTSILLKKVEIR